MATDFDLVVGVDDEALRAELRLLDAAGTQLGYQSLEIQNLPATTVQGLFNLREFVHLFAARPGESGRGAEELIAELGVNLAQKVLGPAIFECLSESDENRTLRVRLPGVETGALAAALARVPWEIAREAADKPTLAEKNVVVRAVVDTDPQTKPLVLGQNEALRVLFIFAEAPGSRPLAARQERYELRELLEMEIYPQRRIEADFLSHGVTRERLTALISDRRGYHVVHWSGHGHRNLLELAGDGGKPDRLSGQDLVELLSAAGGFKPRLFFLSACHSGDVVNVRDWKAFQAVAEGRDPEVRSAEAGSQAASQPLRERPGYTGTAHALLRAGVPSVVAMRYAVGDDYARDLAVDFYRATLAATNPANVAEALNLGRKRLRTAQSQDPTCNYDACDHATPVLYGLADPSLPLPKGRSAYKNRRNPRLGAPLRELDIRQHPHFVGRTWELAGLGAHFIGYHKTASVRPVALVQGIGGMGKTALAAEALELWQAQFDWVLLFQAKPNPLHLDATLHDIHRLLWAELKTYHDHVQQNPADAVWRAADGEGEDGFRGERRLERLYRNLLRAMQDEAILLVLDNFETHLKEHPETHTSGVSNDPLWACQDPGWDRLLQLLATELPGTASRVLITCRRPLMALPAERHHRIVLGPLPAGEAALYLRSHPGLRGLVFSQDATERKLAKRLFHASRFHPLLLDRLARLVEGGAALRKQLEDALRALESTHGYTQLPQLFTARAGGAAVDKQELGYLQDALENSIDLLLDHAGPNARLLLWILALANDPVALGLLRGVWSGASMEQEQSRQLRVLLENLDQLPAELRAKLEEMPAEQREAILATPQMVASSVPDLEPLLSRLITVGLVTAESRGPQDDNPDYTCHELVRERIFTWMAARPDERGGREENSVRLAYAERLEAAFKGLWHQDATRALEAGRRALVYYVQARAYDRLGSFASRLVVSTTDPHLQNALLPHLKEAADSAPAGQARWSCRTYLADALDQAGRPDTSLTYFEQAAAEAQAAGAWNDVAWITGNWANALGNAGYLDASRAKHLESAAAKHRAGRPQVNVVGSELEAYRTDIMQGQAAKVLPEVQERLARLEEWWQRSRTPRTSVPEAPDTVFLARALIGALDIARQAHLAQEDWPAGLSRIDRILQIKRELHRPAQDIAGTRMNRAVVLVQLRQYDAAQAELEACREIFAGDPLRSSKVLSSLADLFGKRGDLPRAVELERRALAMREELPDPSDRAISHNNLANYLEKADTASTRTESACHRLADATYCVATGLGASLQITLRNYAVRFRRAKAAGTTLAVPRLADLLARPDFRPLALWLDERQVNREQLQKALDQLLEQARHAGDS